MELQEGKLNGAGTIVSPTQLEWCYVGKKIVFLHDLKIKIKSLSYSSLRQEETK
jgi:hypothetical protein